MTGTDAGKSVVHLDFNGHIFVQRVLFIKYLTLVKKHCCIYAGVAANLSHILPQLKNKQSRS